MANNVCHDASLPAPLHKTVTQYVGWLSYAAALEVGHHGGRGTTATAMVGGAQFSKL